MSSPKALEDGTCLSKQPQFEDQFHQSHPLTLEFHQTREATQRSFAFANAVRHTGRERTLCANMWLVDANSLCRTWKNVTELECQQDETGPTHRYGILSHRWEADHEEPTFEDYSVLHPPSKTNKRTIKIQECCRIAQSHGLSLVWSDTCCIDKRSSAELQEAINSMYHFYERATICFAYLRDVELADYEESFTKSEWFARGWTLQELLAPADLLFYDRDWKYLGDKKSLSGLICLATGIPQEAIDGQRQLREYSVAQRMSWASRRVTTRIEDRAYSLLGIFDVNMPMLYGEGSKSFIRLQLEIMQSLDDQSIFVWTGLQKGRPGLLAPSPDAFAASNEIRNTRERFERRPYIVNNRGVHGEIPMLPYTLDTCLAVLSCTRRSTVHGDERVGIFLRRLYGDDQYMRVAVRGEEIMQDATTSMALYGGGSGHYVVNRPITIPQSPLLPTEMDQVYTERIQGFRVGSALIKRDADSNPLFSIEGSFDAATRIVSAPMGQRQIFHIGSIDLGPQELDIEVIRFGFDSGYNPVLYLTANTVQYCGQDNEAGNFIQSFRARSADGQASYLLPSGENFQNAIPALGGYWSKCDKSPEGLNFAYMSPNVDGFWALKADRLHGLDVSLVRIHEFSGERECQHVGRVQLSRVVVGGYLLWDLQMAFAPRSNLFYGWSF